MESQYRIEAVGVKNDILKLKLFASDLEKLISIINQIDLMNHYYLEEIMVRQDIDNLLQELMMAKESVNEETSGSQKTTLYLTTKSMTNMAQIVCEATTADDDSFEDVSDDEIQILITEVERIDWGLKPEKTLKLHEKISGEVFPRIPNNF